MTFHNLQNSLIYRLKTQEIAFPRLCISKFSRGGKPPDLPSAFLRRLRRLAPMSLTARYGPVGLRTTCHSLGSSSMSLPSSGQSTVFWPGANFGAIQTTSAQAPVGSEDLSIWETLYRLTLELLN